MVSHTIFFGIALLAAMPAMAGRPLTTEDAAVLEDKACQIETWVDRASDVTLGWFVPTCNFGLGIEWQAGFARARVEGESHFAEAYAQAKGLLRAPRDDSPWGVGLVLGVTRRPLAETYNGWENPYVLLPLSVTAGDFTVHVQPGWLRNRESRREETIWGVAGEWNASDRFTLLAEAFGVSSERPFVRAGMRWVAIKDRLEFDLSWVTRSGAAREDRFASLGLTWRGAAFLP